MSFLTRNTGLKLRRHDRKPYKPFSGGHTAPYIFMSCAVSLEHVVCFAHSFKVSFT